MFAGESPSSRLGGAPEGPAAPPAASGSHAAGTESPAEGHTPGRGHRRTASDPPQNLGFQLWGGGAGGGNPQLWGGADVSKSWNGNPAGANAAAAAAAQPDWNPAAFGPAPPASLSGPPPPLPHQVAAAGGFVPARPPSGGPVMGRPPSGGPPARPPSGGSGHSVGRPPSGGSVGRPPRESGPTGGAPLPAQFPLRCRWTAARAWEAHGPLARPPSGGSGGDGGSLRHSGSGGMGALLAAADGRSLASVDSTGSGGLSLDASPRTSLRASEAGNPLANFPPSLSGVPGLMPPAGALNVGVTLPMGPAADTSSRRGPAAAAAAVGSAPRPRGPGAPAAAAAAPG